MAVLSVSWAKSNLKRGKLVAPDPVRVAVTAVGDDPVRDDRFGGIVAERMECSRPASLRCKAMNAATEPPRRRLTDETVAFVYSLALWWAVVPVAVYGLVIRHDISIALAAYIGLGFLLVLIAIAGRSRDRRWIVGLWIPSIGSVLSSDARAGRDRIGPRLSQLSAPSERAS